MKIAFTNWQEIELWVVIKARTVQQDVHQYRIKSSRIIIIAVVAGILVVWLLFDLLIGGNIRLYTKWIACGQKPVAAMGTGVDAFNVDPNFELNVRVPYHFTPRTMGIIQPSHLFCTPLQAEEAGYSASPSQYEFPAINKYNIDHPDHPLRPGRL